MVKGIDNSGGTSFPPGGWQPDPTGRPIAPRPAASVDGPEGVRPTVEGAALRRLIAPGEEGYESQTAREKQRSLWKAVSAKPYTELPKLGSRGVGGTVGDSLKGLIPFFSSFTFKRASDVQPAHNKFFHPFGSVAMVTMETVGQHPYTGLFAENAAGLVRLSLASDDKSNIPGAALKLFRNGLPSVNIHTIPGLSPQTSHDFFERATSNVIPSPDKLGLKVVTWLQSIVANPLNRPLKHIAATDSNGVGFARPKAPYQVYFRPADVHFAADGTEDFRDSLAKVPTGSVIYKVFATEYKGGPELHIGNLRTSSNFVASDFADRELHFLHEK